MRGDNTDWLALKNIIETCNKTFVKGAVIGNGGAARSACYTLNQLNIPFDIYCRNKIKGNILKEHFDIIDIKTGFVIQDDIDLVIICVPPHIKINYDSLKTNSVIINMGYSSKDDSIIDGFRVLYEQAYYQYKLCIRKIILI